MVLPQCSKVHGKLSFRSGSSRESEGLLCRPASRAVSRTLSATRLNFMHVISGTYQSAISDLCSMFSSLAELCMTAPGAPGAELMSAFGETVSLPLVRSGTTQATCPKSLMLLDS